MPLFLRINFVGTWKRNRWKRKERFRLFTTQSQSSEPHVGYMISTNISIAQRFKMGNLEEARHLFDQMQHRTVSSWNTMISGYSQWGRYPEALTLVSLMHRSSVTLNEVSFSAVLSACARSESLLLGKQVHSLLLKSGYERFGLVGSALLYFCVQCCGIREADVVFEELRDGNQVLWSLMLAGYVQRDMMDDATDMFEKMPTRDVVAWTTLISGYAKREGGCERALDLFGCMRRSFEVVPNEFTLDCVVRVCARLGDLCVGRVVHGLCIKGGFDFDNSIGGALTEFYCDCEAMDDAKRVYESMEGEACLNVANSLIGGLVSKGRMEEAEFVFNDLRDTNPVSFNLMIKGYAMSGQFEKSKRIFEKMSPKTLTSLNTMISVYSKSGELVEAVKLFDKTKGERNYVTWNSMMSGYIINGRHKEALNLYVAMRRMSVDYSRSTFSVLFRACSCLCSFRQGQLLHAHLIKTPFQENVYVGTALVDFYSKCGHLADAQSSFNSIFSPNVAAWTALINGYAYHGLGSEAVLLFRSMSHQGVVPNAATFVGVLSACNHAGLVGEGLRIFHTMQRCYGLTPTIEHYTCVVDLLGRSGHVKEAEEFIIKMPIEADAIIWGALLNASWFWKDMEVGERAAEKLFSMDPNPTFAFVVLSNMYAILGRWGQKTKLRKRLQSLELRKDPGCSWIELNNDIHLFSVEDKTHPYSDVIYATVDHITSTINSIIPFNFLHSSNFG
ncbi:pentatricopeptide repeat-containing protein At2g13600-like [Vigna unguiculata]|uniref:Structure-specific endonuclease subunit SLX1 n=1 Tax=Vigna unguiculata TaxID=3917 RepID=A0A4D6L3N8_VIGUN|nr:pentatricopeptide repeat-containing protein At2g13600-like [Vigna unguiculata]QCD83137.1 structure-specific endonuclease subunit SLX1 [Vigna unguiculata]